MSGIEHDDSWHQAADAIGKYTTAMKALGPAVEHAAAEIAGMVPAMVRSGESFTATYTVDLLAED